MFGKKKHKVLIWKSIISVLIISTGCSNSSSVGIEGVTISGETQGTTYTIIVAEQETSITKQKIDSILHDFDLSLSTYIDESEISQLNKGKNTTIRTGKPYFKECYSKSLNVYQSSNGAFDPSVFPLVKGWGFMKKMETPLDSVQVDSLMQMVSFEPNKLYTISFTEDTIELVKKNPGFQFDFNAIAQGYSVDVLYDYLEEMGHKNFYIEIGGELRVKGKNREGEDWRIGIDTPSEENLNEGTRTISGILSLSNRAIATSGNYRNFYEKDGQKYAHTLNPKTGFPVSHDLLSATVVAKDCATADAYATVFMVIGYDETQQFLADHKELNLDVILIQSKGSGYHIFASKGIEKHFVEE